MSGFRSAFILTLLAAVIQAGVAQTPQTSATPPTLLQAQMRLNTGDAAGAQKLLEQIVAASPTDARAWRLLGTVRRQLKAFPASLAAFEKALELQPANPQNFFDLGVTHAALGDIDAAFEWLGKARATRRVDMTQMESLPILDALRKDPRFAALLPTPKDFENPFVEPVKIVREWHGEASNDQFGWIARSIGDVDGDGAQDIVTSAPTNDRGGQNAGRIYVYSSGRGTLLWAADGGPQDQLGLGVEAAGDVNGDGAGDVIAAAPFGAYAKVYSGRDGRELLTMKSTQPHEAFGRHVHGVGDVNRDGVPDLMVGAPGAGKSPPEFAGRAYVFSGKDGSTLLTLGGERGGDQFGAAVAGEVTKNSFLLIVGAPMAGKSRTGRTYVYTSLSDTPAFVLDADATGAQFGGMFLSVPGDFDGDGRNDVYVSDFPNTAKGASTGRVYVFSSRTGKPIHTFTGENAGEAFGSSPSNAGDVDGDGTPDLIVGAWQYAGAAISGGRAYLYSGKTGALMKTFTCRTPGDTFGFDAVGIGDVDKDGTVDLLITSGWSGVSGFRSGRVFVVSSGVRRAASN